MIDFIKIRNQPTAWTISKELIANALPLLLILYGFKCLMALQGQMLLSIRGQVYNSLRLVTVNGTAAVMVGLAYVSFGIFLYLSDGSPPAENRGWFWRIGRALLRWSGLVITPLCYLRADEMLARRGFNFAGLPYWLLVTIAAFITGIILLLSFLFAMYQREEVKRELAARDCRPLRIIWRPAAYWVSWYRSTAFRVIYSDSVGLIHHGYCFVYRSFRDNQGWGTRRVRWLTDSVIA